MSDFNRLRAAVLALDITLTGQERMAKHNDSQRTDEALRDFAMDLGHTMVYLADGGYSRVFIRFDGLDKPRLTLASESTDKVKAAFPKAAAEQLEVEEAVEDLWVEWLREGGLDPQPATN
jgi:hypothetical protein